MSVEVLNRNNVVELEVKVTLRLVNGEPDNEITELLKDYLPEEEEKSNFIRNEEAWWKFKTHQK